MTDKSPAQVAQEAKARRAQEQEAKTRRDREARESADKKRFSEKFIRDGGNPADVDSEWVKFRDESRRQRLQNRDRQERQRHNIQMQRRF